MVYRQTNNENSYQVRNTNERGYLSHDKYPAQNTDYIGKYIKIRFKSEYRNELDQRFHIPGQEYDDYIYPENTGLRNIYFRILRWDKEEPYRAILLSNLNEVIVTYTTELENDLYDLTDSRLLTAVESRASIKGLDYLRINETDDPVLFFDKLYYEKVKVFPKQKENFIGLTVWSEYDEDLELDRSADVLQYKNKSQYHLTPIQRAEMLKKNPELFAMPPANYETFPYFHNTHIDGKIDDSRRAINKGIVIRADIDDYIEPEFVVMEILEDGTVRFVTQHEANFYYIIEDLEAVEGSNISPTDIISSYYDSINPGGEPEKPDNPDEKEEEEEPEKPDEDDGLIPRVYRLIVRNTETGSTILADIDEFNIENYVIHTGGTYNISNNSLAKNTARIAITVDTEDDVTLILNSLTIDNSKYKADYETIRISSDCNVNFAIYGKNKLTNFKCNYFTKGRSNIYTNGGAINFFGDGSLELLDCNLYIEEFGEYRPIEGIGSTGSITMNGPDIQITSSGVGIYSRSDLIVNTGTIKVASYQSNAIMCSNMTMNNGSLATYSYIDDGIVVFNQFSLTNGKIEVTAMGNGIVTEDFSITGGSLDVTTTYDYAGENLYTDNKVGETNTITYTEDTIVDDVRYYPGTHHGILIGSEERVYTFKQYTYDEDDNEVPVENPEYNEDDLVRENRSGNVVISGGTININTIYTGLQYTDSNRKVWIIGNPGAGIYSYVDIPITGGTINIKSAGEAIHSDTAFSITNGTLDIKLSFKGIIASSIVIGSAYRPSVSVISDNTCISSVGQSYFYVYDHEGEDTYIKTTTLELTNHDISVNDCKLVLKINDTESHEVTLRGYKINRFYRYYSDGDGFKCYGSLYLNAGEVYVYGATGNSENTPMDISENFEIKSGVKLFAIGLNPYVVSMPSVTEQAYITSESPRTNGTYNNIKPGSFVVKGTGVSTNLTVPTKANLARFFLFTTPGMISGVGYTVTSAGTVLGTYKANL